jgi:Na+-driven multidrug efflux pump
MHSLSGIAVLSVLLCVIGTGFTGQLARFLGVNDVYFNYVYDYLFWYSTFTIPAQIGIMLQGFCRNDGAPRLVAVATIVSTATNIFLDWLFIFPMQKGMAGAAIATGISQTIPLCIVLPHFICGKGVLRITAFAPNFALLHKISLRGLPEMIAQFSTPVSAFCMNYALITRIGNDAINAFSIINYVTSFSMMVFFGTSEGMQPLFGQSYGAKKRERFTILFSFRRSDELYRKRGNLCSIAVYRRGNLQTFWNGQGYL